MSDLCADCGRALPDDRFPHCFKCRVSTIAVQYPYGQQTFHDSTIAERVRREWKWADKAAKDGNVFEPIPVRSQNF